MFKNLVTLVTGGASGLGRATVERFAKQGSNVIFCDLKTSNGEHVARITGDNVVFTPADITSETDIQNVVATAKNKFGRIDAVVNCVGISMAYPMYNFNMKRTHSLEKFQHILNTNVMGTYNVIRQTAALMKENAVDKNGYRGVIITTSAAFAFEGMEGQVPYTASTAAIIGMTKPLAKDFQSHGIRVVCLAPGYFLTPLTDYVPEYVRQVISTENMLVPNRFGDPDEYAYLVQNVIENPLINGTTIKIDAGLSNNYLGLNSSRTNEKTL